MPWTRPSLALAILALALSGCGDAGAPVRERTPRFTVTLDDYMIRPQQLRVPKGGRLTATVVNRGPADVRRLDRALGDDAAQAEVEGEPAQRAEASGQAVDLEMSVALANSGDLQIELASKVFSRSCS